MAVEQNVIAMMYDCDLTLTPSYMQKVLFDHFGVNERDFWEQNDSWQEKVRDQGVHFDDECVYMNSILKYVREEKFKGLSNNLLKELGANLKLFAGLPDFFKRMKDLVEAEDRYRCENIKVEHYIISTGMERTIRGSALGVVDGIFASEFYEQQGEIAGIARTVGYAKKTEYIHLINKGGNKDSCIGVNSLVSLEDRRIPFTQMIYVGDGPTDVPCFATLNHKGGKSFAVYHPHLQKAFAQAYQLQEEGRVFSFAAADYQDGSHLSNTLEYTVRQMADGIVERRKNQKRARIREEVGL